MSSRYTTLSSGGSTSWDDDTLWVRATARVNVRSGPGTGYDDIARWFAASASATWA